MEDFRRTATTLSIQTLLQAQLIALRAPKPRLKSRRTYRLRYNSLRLHKFRMASLIACRLPLHTLLLAS